MEYKLGTWLVHKGGLRGPFECIREVNWELDELLAHYGKVEEIWEVVKTRHSVEPEANHSCSPEMQVVARERLTRHL